MRLTTGPAHESAPAISPDGKWVAYLSNARGGATDVWVKNVAGGDQVNLTAAANLSLQTQSDIGGLSISPDGATVTFDAGVPQTGWVPAFTAWAIPAPLGGMPRKLVTRGRAVQWSRDGTKIVYVMPGSSAGDALWVADADGGNAREVAPRRGGIHKHWAAWSADGRYIYFNSSYSTFNYEGGEIYRLPSDGGSAEPVVTTARRAGYAAPMPDGSGIIYAANPDTDDAGLWWRSLQRIIAAPERLTAGIGEYVEPYISADGTSRRVHAPREEAGARPAGAGVARRSRAHVLDERIHWRPRPGHGAFGRSTGLQLGAWRQSQPLDIAPRRLGSAPADLRCRDRRPASILARRAAHRLRLQSRRPPWHLGH